MNIKNVLYCEQTDLNGLEGNPVWLLRAVIDKEIVFC